MVPRIFEVIKVCSLLADAGVQTLAMLAVFGFEVLIFSQLLKRKSACTCQNMALQCLYLPFAIPSV